jgi:hypothetical protein
MGVCRNSAPFGFSQTLLRRSYCSVEFRFERKSRLQERKHSAGKNLGGATGKIWASLGWVLLVPTSLVLYSVLMRRIR